MILASLAGGSAAAAPAPAGLANELASVSSSGAQAQGPLHSLGTGEAPAVSGDDRFVVFPSEAPNLVASDTNGRTDVFVHDRATGATERVSVTSAGAEADGDSENAEHSVSADGRRVVFMSNAPELGAPENGFGAFLHDRLTGETARIDVASDGTPGNDALSGPPVISADGRWAAFCSFSTNLVPRDTNGQGDVFVRDLLTGRTERVSVTSAGGQSAGISFFGPREIDIDAHGDVIAFTSDASDLVPDDRNDAFDVFVRDRAAGTTSLVSRTSSGAVAAGFSVEPSLSADGRLVVFRSDAPDLSPGEPQEERVYVRDRRSATTEPVPAPAGRSVDGAPNLGAGGRLVLMTAGGAVFLHDRVAGTTVRVSVSPGGAPVEGSGGAALSPDGRLAAFVSVDPLVPGDRLVDADVVVRILAPPRGAADTAPPTVVQAPIPRLHVGAADATGASVALRWYAADLAGVCRYELEHSAAGRPFVGVPIPPDAIETTLTLRVGIRQQFRLRATDCAGNAGPAVTAAPFRVEMAQEDDPAVGYPDGRWLTAHSARFLGGAERFTRQAGAAASFRFDGTGVAWVASRNRFRGEAFVLLDGRPIAVVNLRGRSTVVEPAQVVFARSGLRAGPHTLRLIARGDPGHPRVDVDAFVVLAPTS